MGTKKNVTIAGVDHVKIVKNPDLKKAVTASPELEGNLTETAEIAADQADTIVADPAAQAAEAAEATAAAAKKTVKHLRSKKYQAVRSKIDKTKFYSPTEAIELIKKISYSKFDGTVTAHLIVREVGDKADIRFPHSTGKTINAVIFDDKVMAQIEAGNLDFDILLATPKDMPQLTKFARILGPKGLMPNPKNGTLTPKPEIKKKELEGGKITVKTEKKAPLIHVSLGKVSMPTTELVENLNALLKTFKDRALKLSLAASMSPGVKVLVEE